MAEEQQQGLLRTRSMDYGSELDARAHPPYDLIWQLPLRRIMIVRTMFFVALSDNSQRPSLTIQPATPCHTKYALRGPIRQEARLRGPKACSPDTWSATMVWLHANVSTATAMPSGSCSVTHPFMCSLRCGCGTTPSECCVLSSRRCPRCLSHSSDTNSNDPSCLQISAQTSAVESQ